MLEIRAKCRRLKAEGKLGLVIIDYLQLMRSSSPVENRVQEISQISRGLKALAKELGVPIIALSQLSRAAGDAGNEPKLSTLRECVTGDTIVCLADGRRVPIQQREHPSRRRRQRDCHGVWRLVGLLFGLGGVQHRNLAQRGIVRVQCAELPHLAHLIPNGHLVAV